MSEKKLTLLADGTDGSGVTRLQAIKALENPLFDKDEKIILYIGDRQSIVTAIFVCKACDKIHLLGGWFDSDSAPLSERGGHFEVYADTSLKDGTFISVKEAITALKQIDGDNPIIYGFDNTGNHWLTEIFKCSDDDCRMPHFYRGFKEDYFKVKLTDNEAELEFKKTTLNQEQLILKNDIDDSFLELEHSAKGFSISQLIILLQKEGYSEKDLPEFEKRGMYNFCEAIKQMKYDRAKN